MNVFRCVCKFLSYQWRAHSQASVEESKVASNLRKLKILCFGSTYIVIHVFRA